jgi:hypothetical protein
MEEYEAAGCECRSSVSQSHVMRIENERANGLQCIEFVD